MSEQQWVEEIWAYAGRRTYDNKVYAVWVDDKGRGQERWYGGKRPKATVGCLYTAKVQRETGEDGKQAVILVGEPVLRGGSWDGPEGVADPRPDWVARDHAFDVAQQRKRLENAAAKAETDLDRAIKPLLDIARQLRTGSERDALTAYVLRRMSGVQYYGGKAVG